MKESAIILKKEGDFKKTIEFINSILKPHHYVINYYFSKKIIINNFKYANEDCSLLKEIEQFFKHNKIKKTLIFFFSSDVLIIIIK